MSKSGKFSKETEANAKNIIQEKKNNMQRNKESQKKEYMEKAKSAKGALTKAEEAQMLRVVENAIESAIENAMAGMG